MACVSDSYNIWYTSTQFVAVIIKMTCREACEKLWGEELKNLVEDRGKRGV